MSRIIHASALAVALFASLPAMGQNTEMTYQGEVRSGGIPVTDRHDLTFRVFDDPIAGTQYGPTLCIDNAIPDQGRFTIGLDFGAIYDGRTKYLEIQVRADLALGCADSAGWVLLTPRQKITPSPLATFAQNAETATSTTQLNGQAASFYQNATNLSSGTLADARLSSNVALLNTEQYYTDSQHFTARAYFYAAGAPFEVESNGLVTNLNADLLDGLNSTAFLQSIPVPLTLSGTSGTHIIRAENASTGFFPMAIYGLCTGASGSGTGVRGESLSVNGRGLYGQASAATGTTYGGDFLSNSTSGRGVHGMASAGSGVNYGGYFESASVSGYGVFGYATASTGTNFGLYGRSDSPDGYAGYFIGGKNYFGGNVGIGNTTPPAKLTVNGPESTSPTTGCLLLVGPGVPLGALMSMDGDSIDGWSHLQLNPSSTSDILMVEGGGNVGIGTASPAVKLHIVGGTDSGPTGGGFIVAGNTASANISIDNNEIMARNNGVVSTLYLNNNGSDVVIAPQGITRVRVLEITGADLAEKFPVSDTVKPEPGMVVMIDAANAGKLCLASGAYNKRVAGVISGANNLPAGTILGNLPGNEDAPPVALSGRVWVHCDAATQAIEPGDLLTTSATPGHAMVASDAARSHGAVIGKAMTALKRGEKGMVLVLVNLH